jgi:hypothetical protein
MATLTVTKRARLRRPKMRSNILVSVNLAIFRD